MKPATLTDLYILRHQCREREHLVEAVERIRQAAIRQSLSNLEDKGGDGYVLLKIGDVNALLRFLEAA